MTLAGGRERSAALTRGRLMPWSARTPTSQVIVMTLKTSISLAFAAACLTAVATMPAHAATGSARQSQSDHYTRMLETNRGFREARMRKECGPITDPQLHQQCLASFSQDEPMVASAASHRRVASSRHHAKQYLITHLPQPILIWYQS